MLGALVLGALLSGACNKDDNNNNNTAVVPQQPCGNGIPSQYCTSFNPTAYPYYGQGGYNYGLYGFSPTAGIYGCPVGYQPVYTGGFAGGYYAGSVGMAANAYTCVSYNYFSNYYSGYNFYQYPGTGWGWPGGISGYGPLQYCDSNVGGSCGTATNAYCQPQMGQRMGFCISR